MSIDSKLFNNYLPYNPYTPYTKEADIWEESYGRNRDRESVNKGMAEEDAKRLAKYWRDKQNQNALNTEDQRVLDWQTAHNTVVNDKAEEKAGRTQEWIQRNHLQGQEIASPSMNGYQQYGQWLQSLRKAYEYAKEYDYTDLQKSLQNAFRGQQAQGMWKFGNERRPDEGQNGVAGDVRFSGVTGAQAQRLQNQVTQQETLNAPAQVARQSMFDALQARINKQLNLQDLQSEQSRDLAIKKMIYEKQAGELKLKEMKDQIDTQYMNSLISTIGNMFGNAIGAYGMWDRKRRAAAEVWPEQQLSNSAAKFTNTWNTNYTFLE